MGQLPDFKRDTPLRLLWNCPKAAAGIAEALGLTEVNKTVVPIVFALTRASIMSGNWTSYSRRACFYSSIAKIYRDELYTFRKVVAAVDMLDRHGLIDHDKAPQGRLGWQSTMRAKKELIQLALPYIVEGIQIRLPRTCLRLKDGEKNLIHYERSRSIDAMVRDISAFNEALLSIDFGPSISSQTYLLRVFNNGRFSQGGRFYAAGGGWQTLPKEDRLKLTIDNEPVVEIDYSELHPTLTYHKAGLPVPSGTYDIPGYPRSLVKIAFNIMLNCRTEHQARGALASKPAMLNHLVGSETFGKGNAKQLRIAAAAFDPTLNQPGLETAAAIIDELKQKHRSIEQMFFSGMGLELQRLESQIASMVMKTMRKRGEMPLPVHDSMIVRSTQADYLEQAMVEAGERKRIHLTCKRSSIVSMG